MARVARAGAGWALLAVGTALLVLPGPGIPLILGGLALLAREYRWARRARVTLRARWRAARRGRWGRGPRGIRAETDGKVTRTRAGQREATHDAPR